MASQASTTLVVKSFTLGVPDADNTSIHMKTSPCKKGEDGTTVVAATFSTTQHSIGLGG